MQVSVFSFLPATGWSIPLDPRLDSGRTLVLAFGASGLVDAHGPIDDVLAAYPQARILGCSTSGEVHGTRIHDDSLVVAVARFEDVHLREASAPVVAASDSFAAGESIAHQLQADDLRAVGATLAAVNAARVPFAFALSQTPRAKITDEAARVLAQHGRVAPVNIAQRVSYAETGATGQGVTETTDDKAGAEIAAVWDYVKGLLDG